METPYLNMNTYKNDFDNEGLWKSPNLWYLQNTSNLLGIWLQSGLPEFVESLKLEDWKLAFALLNARFQSKLKESGPLLYPEISVKAERGYNPWRLENPHRFCTCYSPSAALSVQENDLGFARTESHDTKVSKGRGGVWIRVNKRDWYQGGHNANNCKYLNM